MRRPNGVFRCGAVLVLTVVGVLGWDASAFASSQTFMPNEGPEQQFKVPAGVTQIQVTAVGGAGQQGSECTAGGGGAGGGGAEITAQLPVSEGETLSIDFGGGAGSEASLCSAGAGGEGGGASRVASDSPSSPLVVAGGGGGGGAGFGTDEPTVAIGGAGGSATNLVGSDGASGSSNEGGAPVLEGGGGGGGTESSGGEGGSAAEGFPPGSEGVLGSGGAGTSANLFTFGSGGGGGGGYFGGGGGAAGALAGGGGGAGSSFIAPSASDGKVTVDETAPQEVVISFPGSTGPTAPTGTTGSTGTGGGPSTGGSGNTGGGGVLGSISTNIGSAQIAALLGQELTPAGRAAKIATLLKTSGFAITFKALEAGTAVIDWYDVPAGAKLAKKTKPEPILVASGQITFPAAGTTSIKIKPTAAGRRLLKKAKSLKLVAKGTFTPTGKAPVIATKAFVLNR